MPYTETWDETTPQGATQRGFELDDEIQAFKRAVRERAEGFDNLTGLVTDYDTDAKPKEGMARVFFGAEATLGTKPLEDGRLFVATDTHRLFSLLAAGAQELAYADPSKAEVYTATQSFNPGTTPAIAIDITIDALVATGQRDSHALQLTARAFDAGAHTINWQAFIDVTSDAGASRFRLTSRIDAAGFVDRLVVEDDGDVIVGKDLVASRIQSVVTTGTSPFIVASTTVVANLNADLLDGQGMSFYTNASNISAGILSVTRGGTGVSNPSANNLLMGAGASPIVGIAPGAAGQVVRSTGATWASAALVAGDLPSHTHAAADITSGTLVVARGGTGVSSPTSGNLLVGAGASAMTLLAPGAAGGYVRSNGSAWVRSTIQAADLPAHTHTAAEITAGTFASGDFVFQGALTAQRRITTQLSLSITANQDDFDLQGAGYIVRSGTGNIQFTGFAGGVNGREITFVNSSSAATMTFLPNNVGSAAANRIAGSQTVTLGQAESVTFIYGTDVEGTLDRWVVKCTTGTLS